MRSHNHTLSDHVGEELALARGCSDPAGAFHHLERAHILSQYATRDHVRVHLAMLHWGIMQGDLREGIGQILRIIGAATKTAIGWIPVGNTGGSNVSPIEPMALPQDLADIIAHHRN